MILRSEFFNAFGGDVFVLFWAINAPLHRQFRMQVRVKDNLLYSTQKTNPLRPITTEPDTANQWIWIARLLDRLMHLFQ
ncbi:Uncharacterised protein [Vibrio cholerae]|nr:Uncharacterised protein [Vibrio cholerae]